MQGLERQIYLALGANLGDPAAQVRAAAAALSQLGRHFRLSPLYLNPAVSAMAQPDFVNAVCCFHSSLTLNDLWKNIQAIERQLGKRPKSKDHPRLIDVDLLFFGDEVHTTPVIIPHPRWRERRFVLRPLLALTDEIKIEHKILNIRELEQNCEN